MSLKIYIFNFFLFYLHVTWFYSGVFQYPLCLSFIEVWYPYILHKFRIYQFFHSLWKRKLLVPSLLRPIFYVEKSRFYKKKCPFTCYLATKDKCSNCRFCFRDIFFNYTCTIIISPENIKCHQLLRHVWISSGVFLYLKRFQYNAAQSYLSSAQMTCW